jgi:hypothetical protein
MAEDKNQPNQLNIELPEDIAEGIYANLAIISHSHSEFVVDFIRHDAQCAKGKSQSSHCAHSSTCQKTDEGVSR